MAASTEVFVGALTARFSSVNGLTWKPEVDAQIFVFWFFSCDSFLAVIVF